MNDDLPDDVLKESIRVKTEKDKIRVCEISKTFSNFFMAVKGTSFGVKSGEVFGLLGPNGAGKSTTFNMITSRLKPTSGSIYLMD